MYIINKFLIFSVIILVSFVFTNSAFAADRYWVGGTASWDGTANSEWSTTSGGAGGASEPTASDNVFFDGNSGSGTVTISTTTALTNNLDFTGFTGTLAGSTALTISGSLTLGAGMTRTYTGAITFSSSSGTNTITSNGKTFGSAVSFSSGTWQLADAFTTTGSFVISGGTFSTNDNTITVASFASSGGSHTVNLGASSFYITSSGGVWNASFSGMTFNAGTSTVYFTASAGLTLGSYSFYNITYTGSAVKTNYLAITNTLTVTGTLTVNGNSATNRILICGALTQGCSPGDTRTINAANVSFSNVDFMDITAAGSASWDLSGISGSSGNCLGNTGITFTSPTTKYWVSNGGNWSDTSHWSLSSGGASGAAVPLCHDNIVFDSGSFSSGSQTVTADMLRLGTNINFTGVTNTPTFSATSASGYTILGSLTFISGMNVTMSQTVTFSPRSMVSLTSAGKSFAARFFISAPGGGVTLQDDFVTTATNSSILLSGTFNANNYNASFGRFSASGSTTRTLTMGSGTWTLTGTGTIWDVSTSTNLTFNPNTSTIKVTNTTATARTFSGGSLTYNNFWNSAGTSTASLTIAGSNTFNDFKDTGTAAHSILFTTGTTQNVSTWNVSGSAGNLITINSTTTGTHTLTKSGAVTSSDYLNIQHSVATPSNKWYAGTHSTDNQSVSTAGSGWIFSAPDLTAPIISEVTPITTPTNDNTPNYTFTTDEAGTISYGGDCASVTTSATFGSNTITFSTLTDGVHSNCTITVTDSSGNISNLLLISSFTIDTTLPTISSVSSDKNNGTYGLGEIIDIDVTFSEFVTSTGNVIITLETGVTDRTCNFTISNSTTGSCNYTVQLGDSSLDLNTNSISGTISDQASNSMTNFVPSTNLAANKSLVILTDSEPPTITNVSSDKSNGGYTIGEVIDIDVTFSEAVTSTGNVTVTLETGTTDRTCIFTVSSSTTGTCNYTVQVGDTSSDLTVNTISGTIADVANNSMSNFVPATNLAANKALIIDALAPTISEVSPIGTSFDTTPAYTFTTNEVGTISYGGSCTSSTTSATLGNNTINFSTLVLGTYSNCSIIVTDTAGNASNTLTVSSFSVNAQASVPVWILQAMSDRERNQSQTVLNHIQTPLNPTEGCTSTTKYSPITGNKCPTTDTNQPKTTTCPTLPAEPKVLKLNTIHSTVKVLQQILNCKGYVLATTGPGSSGNETSKFGSLTLREIIKFQKDNGIQADGIVGAETRFKLNQ